MENIEVLFDKNPNLKNIIVTISAPEMDEQVKYLMEIVKNAGVADLFVLDEIGRQHRISEAGIIRIEVTQKVVTVQTCDGVYRLNRSLQDVESMLHSRMFLKISRFEIINLQRVRNFDFTVAGTLKIEFEDGSFTWASRRFIPLIRQRLSERDGEQ